MPFPLLLLHQNITFYCDSYMKPLALIGAWYTARRSIGFLCEMYNLLRVHCTSRLFRQIDFVQKYGAWAVVTGATAGIGKCYAEELAHRGVNVILISRSEEKLKCVSSSIAEKYHVETSYIVADFSKGSEIYPSIKNALRDVEVGILVNNVGVFYDYPEYFGLLTEKKIWDIININMAAASMMVHLVLPGMLDRKKGAIVNVASAACYRPTPLAALYSGSKAFLDLFTRSLHYEYGSSGIFFQCITPYFIATDMTSFSSRLHNLPLLVPSDDVFCRHAVPTLGLSTRTAGYWIHHLTVLLQRCMPEWLCVFIIKHMLLYFRKEALSRIQHHNLEK
ncbi:inactive hydroxysteroid dehydrogenase-like protein 1 [Pleurodeles waltl]